MTILELCDISLEDVKYFVQQYSESKAAYAESRRVFFDSKDELDDFYAFRETQRQSQESQQEAPVVA